MFPQSKYFRGNNSVTTGKKRGTRIIWLLVKASDNEIKSLTCENKMLETIHKKKFCNLTNFTIYTYLSSVINSQVMFQKGGRGGIEENHKDESKRTLQHQLLDKII